MKKGYIRLLIVLSCIIFICAFFFIFPNLNSWNSLIYIIVISSIIMYYFLGYEKQYKQDEISIIIIVLIFIFMYYGITYALALRTGLLESLYSHKPITLLKNITPLLVIISLTEFMRYIVVTKGHKYKTIYILSLILFVMIDVLYFINSQTFIDNNSKLEFILKDVFPSISKNICLFYIIRITNFKPAIVYRILMELPLYFLPYFPDFNEYLQICINIIIPLLLQYIIFASLRFSNRGKIEENATLSIVNAIVTSLVWSLIVIIIMLSSGIFKYQSLTIASSSMQGTINKGDIVVFKKINKNEIDEIKEGDILVFEYQRKIIVHRLIKIVKMGNKRYFYTKGDANIEEDKWVNREENIMGTTEIRLPVIGWPSVWLEEVI